MRHDGETFIIRDPLDHWIRIKKLCSRTGETESHVRDLINSGMLPARYLGKITYVNERQFNDLIEAQPTTREEQAGQPRGHVGNPPLRQVPLSRNDQRPTNHRPGVPHETTGSQVVS